MAGSSQAVAARQKAEKQLRKVVREFADRTPLALGMVVVRDNCPTGRGEQPFFQDGSDTYKIKCWMTATAYYGADPRHMDDVVDGILTAGESHPDIPFTHDETGSKLLAYYRHHGPNPNGPKALDPSEVFAWGQSLTWDPVRDHDPGRLIEEPSPGKNDPPVQRFVREPESATVAGVRKRYGMVFRLQLASTDYYKVFKSGRTRTG
ncbi:hypothetical protein ACH41H_10780 [Streptomyces sp. NPDC020800]|uniref:hypothetical protein n=1 Tax=Streptomyces sp. NPDC020800 TaxID=3365092 RepID=UPI0037A0B5E0